MLEATRQLLGPFTPGPDAHQASPTLRQQHQGGAGGSTSATNATSKTMPSPTETTPSMLKSLDKHSSLYSLSRASSSCSAQLEEKH